MRDNTKVNSISLWHSLFENLEVNWSDTNFHRLYASQSKDRGAKSLMILRIGIYTRG
jgi:hypothetical protein